MILAQYMSYIEEKFPTVKEAVSYIFNALKVDEENNLLPSQRLYLHYAQKIIGGFKVI